MKRESIPPCEAGRKRPSRLTYGVNVKEVDRGPEDTVEHAVVERLGRAH